MPKIGFFYPITLDLFFPDWDSFLKVNIKHMFTAFGRLATSMVNKTFGTSVFSSRWVRVAIWGAWCVHFGTRGNHFGTSGALWRTMGAAGWARGGPEPDFHWFWFDFGSHFESFSAHRLEITISFRFFPGHFFYRFVNRNLDAWALEIRFSHGRYCKKMGLKRGLIEPKTRQIFWAMCRFVLLFQYTFGPFLVFKLF